MRGEAIDKILIDILWGTPTTYLGIAYLSRDEVPHSFNRYPSASVANTDPSSLPGQHWVAFYLLSPSHLEFFDSYGCHPDDYHFPTQPTTAVGCKY